MSTTLTGPVEIAVLEFPGIGFNAEIVPALAELVGDGIVTIIDLVLVAKQLDGTLTTIEIADLDAEAQAAFGQLAGAADGQLSEADLATASEVLSPGSSAMLIVWENTWAHRLVDAIGGSGGRLAVDDPIDTETVALAVGVG